MKYATATLAALALATAAPAQAPAQRTNCSPSRAALLTPEAETISRLIDLAERYHERLSRVESRLGSLETWRTEVDGRLAALERKYATPALASANGFSPVANGNTGKANGNPSRNGHGNGTGAAPDKSQESPPRARAGTLTGENTLTIPKPGRYRIVIQIIPVED